MVILYEQQENEIETELDEAIVDLERTNKEWKRSLGLSRVPFDVDRSSDPPTIIPRNICGQVEIGGEVFEVVPKYLTREDEVIDDWREMFLSILVFSESEQFDIGPAERIRGTPTAAPLTDILARAFIDQLSEALIQGPPADYTQREEKRQHARGRLVSRKLYPQVLTDPTKLWYRTTEFTSDTDLGRILRWACTRFAKLVSSRSLVNELNELESRFGDAKPTRPSSLQLQRFSLSPQHRQFEGALEIAQWLAEHSEAVYSGDKVHLPGLLFKSDDVYEAFVDSVFSAIDASWDYRGKRSYDLASGPSPKRIIPDHVIAVEDNDALVLDSKYSETNAPSASQFYEVMAYGRIVGTETVGLVYPRLTGSENPLWEIEEPGEPMYVIGIEIDPVEFIRSRGGFFESVEKRVSSALSM